MMPPVRRSLAVLITALLAVAWTVGISIPASAAPARALEIFSVRADDPADAELCPSVDRCAILEDRPFTVRVRVVDRAGQPATVSKDTTIVLEKQQLSGESFLVPKQNVAIIRRDGSEATFGALQYTESGNPTLVVRVTSGVQLNSDEITVPIALTAVRGNPEMGKLDLVDPNCGAGSGVPTSEQPTCGHLVTTGANGPVVMSVGSCEEAGSCLTVGGTRALVVTVNADIQHSPGEYSTVILSCDKVLCGGTGVPKLPVIYTFDNNGDLTQTAPACPRKNDLGSLEICVDYVQSMRSDSDLYLVVLFDHDLRMSGG